MAADVLLPGKDLGVGRSCSRDYPLGKHIGRRPHHTPALSPAHLGCSDQSGQLRSAEELTANPFGRLGVHLLAHVRVDVQRDRHAGVTQQLLDLLGMGAAAEGKRRSRVAEVVQADRPDASSAHGSLEVTGQVAGVDQRPEGGGEHEAAVMPGRPDEKALFLLRSLMPTQGVHHLGVEGDGSPGGCRLASVPTTSAGSGPGPWSGLRGSGVIKPWRIRQR